MLFPTIAAQRLKSSCPGDYPYQLTGINPPLTRIADSLRQCLLLAAFACILRPTNVLVWMTLASFAWLRTSWSQRTILAREVLVCGSATSILDLCYFESADTYCTDRQCWQCRLSQTVFSTESGHSPRFGFCTSILRSPWRSFTAAMIGTITCRRDIRSCSPLCCLLQPSVSTKH